MELLAKETLLKDEIERIFAKVRAVKPRPAWTGSNTRVPSTQPPVATSPAASKKEVVVEEVAVEQEAAPVKKATRKKASPPRE